MKVRPDSLYGRLNPEQRDVLFLELHESGCDLKKAVELCKKWGVVTSRSGVSRCYSEHFFGWKLERAKIAADATADSGTFDPERRRLIGQKVFEELAKADASPRFLAAALSMEIERDKLTLAEKSAKTRFELEREKLEVSKRRVTVLENRELKAKATLKDTKLSPSEKLAKINEIFGKAA